MSLLKEKIKESKTENNSPLKTEEIISILNKADKKKLSPRVYYLGNIQISSNIHRYCIIESYDTTLKDFIKKKLYLEIIKNDDEFEIFDEIIFKILNIIKSITELNIVYYDIKPDNIVINFKKDNKMEIKFIDWDSDYCVEEEWLKDNEKNKDIVEFISILIISFYLKQYIRNNVFYKHIRKLYNKSDLSLIFDIILNPDNQYLIIILTYFYKSFEIAFNEIDYYYDNINDEIINSKMKKNVLKMIEGSYFIK